MSSTRYHQTLNYISIISEILYYQPKLQYIDMSEMYVVIYSLLSNRIIYRVCQKWRNKYFYFLLFPPHFMMHSKFPDCAMRHTADQSGGVTDTGITHASFMLTSSNFSCILKQVLTKISI